MGYTTTFDGAFELNTPLKPTILKYLTLFSETRRMKRNQDEGFGIEGEFFVFGTGYSGQNHTSDIIDYNSPPSTQPSLWCQWIPNEEGTHIEWDGGEKFYYYQTWLVYLIEKILKPNGYVLNGSVSWSGEDPSDVGVLKVVNNVVYAKDVLLNPSDKINPDVVLILSDNPQLLNSIKLLE